MEKVYLDVCIAQCPECKTYYAEASWYAIELECDLQCNKCGKSFSPKRFSTDRVMVEFEVSEEGKVKKVRVAEEN